MSDGILDYYEFVDATLLSVGPPIPMVGSNNIKYYTTYINGLLTLGVDGPWYNPLDPGPYDVTVANINNSTIKYFDAPGVPTGEMSFILDFSDWFDAYDYRCFRAGVYARYYIDTPTIGVLDPTLPGDCGVNDPPQNPPVVSDVLHKAVVTISGPVPVDVMTEECPNFFNVCDDGIITAAILGGASYFNLNDIDQDKIVLNEKRWIDYMPPETLDVGTPHGELCYEKDSAREAIENGKIVCCGFCSIDKKGYRCAEVVEKEVGGEIRGKRVDEEKHEFATCLICGEEATCTVYIAKSY